MKSTFSKQKRSKIEKSIVAKLNCSSGIQSNNPLLTNKGCIKDEDILNFFLLTPVINGRNLPCVCPNKQKIDNSENYLVRTQDNFKAKFSKNVQSMKSGLSIKSHMDLACTHEEVKKPSKPLRITDKIALCGASLGKSKLTGYEISFKDVDKFLQPPIKENLNKRLSDVSVNDIN